MTIKTKYELGQKLYALSRQYYPNIPLVRIDGIRCVVERDNDEDAEVISYSVTLLEYGMAGHIFETQLFETEAEAIKNAYEVQGWE